MEGSSRWGSSDGSISRGSVGSMRGCRVAIKLFDFAAKAVICLKPLISLPPLPVFRCSHCSGVSIFALFDSVNFSWRENFDIRCDYGQFLKSYLANATIDPGTSPARRNPLSAAVHTEVSE